MAPMAQYYDLPMLSYRALVWEKMLRREPGWQRGDLTKDIGHPNDRGHMCVPWSRILLPPFCGML